MSYTPYGEKVKSATWGADIFHQKYTGQVDDGEDSELLYYNARYYDPVIGRFISADTTVPDAGFSQCFNRYMYAIGNPITYNDPSGHIAVIGGRETGHPTGTNKDAEGNTGKGKDGTGGKGNPGGGKNGATSGGRDGGGKVKTPKPKIPGWATGPSSLRLYNYLIKDRAKVKDAILKAIDDAYEDTMRRERTEPDPGWGARNFPIMMDRVNINWKDEPFIKAEMEKTRRVKHEYESKSFNPNQIISRILISDWDYEKNRDEGFWGDDGYRFDNLHLKVEDNIYYVHFDRFTDITNHLMLEAYPTFKWRVKNKFNGVFK